MQPGKNGFHVNRETQEVGPCNATIKSCKVGGAGDHFADMESAAGHLEGILNEEYGHNALEPDAQEEARRQARALAKRRNAEKLARTEKEPAESENTFDPETKAANYGKISNDDRLHLEELATTEDLKDKESRKRISTESLGDWLDENNSPEDAEIASPELALVGPDSKALQDDWDKYADAMTPYQREQLFYNTSYSKDEQKAATIKGLDHKFVRGIIEGWDDSGESIETRHYGPKTLSALADSTGSPHLLKKLYDNRYVKKSPEVRSHIEKRFNEISTAQNKLNLPHMQDPTEQDYQTLMRTDEGAVHLIKNKTYGEETKRLVAENPRRYEFVTTSTLESFSEDQQEQYLKGTNNHQILEQVASSPRFSQKVRIAAASKSYEDWQDGKRIDELETELQKQGYNKPAREKYARELGVLAARSDNPETQLKLTNELFGHGKAGAPGLKALVKRTRDPEVLERLSTYYDNLYHGEVNQMARDKVQKLLEVRKTYWN